MFLPVNVLQNYLGAKIRFVGEESYDEGFLIGVKDDYLTLYEDGRLLHYPLQHLESALQYFIEQSGAPIENENNEEDESEKISLEPFQPVYQQFPETFPKLLETTYGKRVKLWLLQGGAAEGLVFYCGADFITLVVSPDELRHVPTRQIRVVSFLSLDPKKYGRAMDQGQQPTVLDEKSHQDVTAEESASAGKRHRLKAQQRKAESKKKR